MRKQREYATTFGFSIFEGDESIPQPDHPLAPEWGGPWELLSTHVEFYKGTVTAEELWSDAVRLKGEKWALEHCRRSPVETTYVRHVWTWGEVER